MDQILGGLGLWAAGLVIGALANSVIPKWIGKIMAKFRSDAQAKAKELLKDPEWKAIATQVILKVQKDMASESGKVRMRAAITFFQKLIPTDLDDKIVEAVIQSMYNELLIPIEL